MPPSFTWTLTGGGGTSYSVDAFLASIRRRGRLPVAAESWSDEDLIAIANEELETDIVPFLMSVREEYLVATADAEVTEEDATYPLPLDAVGNKVRLVSLAADGSTFVPLNRVEPERENETYGFKLEANNIILTPPSATFSGTLRLVYIRRPAALEAAGDFDTAIPRELIPLLAQLVVTRVLEAEGDPKWQASEKTADRMRQRLVTVLTPRTEGNPRVIVNRNAPGWGRKRAGIRTIGGSGSDNGGLF